MAFQAYLSVTAAKQGKFKGESTAAQRKDWIPVLAFTMELAVPRDASSGLPTGKRQYQPITVTKEWGAASPQGLTACATNEALTTVRIEFVRANPAGQESVFQAVTLTNATLSEIRRFTGDPLTAEGLAGGSKEAAGLERWMFTFQKIQVDDNDGKTTFVDDWSTRP